MKNHFHPYHAHSPSVHELHLTLPSWMVAISFLAWRAIPLLMLSLIAGLFIFEEKNLPWFIQTTLVLLVPLAVFMMTNKVIREVIIASSIVKIRSMRFFSSVTTTYPLSEIARLEVSVNNQIRGGAIFYNLKLKNDKSVRLLNQPTLLVDAQMMKNVLQELKRITQLEVTVSGHYQYQA